MRAARPDGSVLVANAVLFGRALRRAGIPADPDQTRMFLQALRAVGAGHRGDAKAAGRAVYVRCHEHRRIYDAAFDLFWRRATVVGRPSVGLPRLQQRRARPADVAFPGDHATAADVAGVVHAPQRVVASAAEHLRTADFGELTAKEARDAARMIESLRPRLPWRVSRRRCPGGSGDRPALRHIMRRSVATGGEALRWFWLRRARRPRPVALICDISGSMERYSRFLLRFAHALTRAGAPVEVFVFGTRLTRITRDLRARDADSALRQVAQRVVDWSGGTRIGESLRVLNRRWVRRTIRSGAVVLLASDGWERGDPALLRREAAALRRACHRLIWLHPLAARAGFLPATQGLQAVLPHVDQLASCGDVASLEALARTLWQTR